MAVSKIKATYSLLDTLQAAAGIDAASAKGLVVHG
jgi:hypothetical protein